LKLSLRKFLNIYTHEGKCLDFQGTPALILKIIAITMSFYQIWEVLLGALDPIQHESIHLAFILVLTYFIYTPSKSINIKKITIMDILCIILVIASAIYFFLNTERIVTRAPMFDPLSNWDIFFGIIIVVLSFEGVRRTLGGPITFVILVFFLYIFFGHHLGGLLWHRKLNLMDIVDQLTYTLNGIWGSPIAVSSTFVFMFILFGSFLREAKAGDFFFKISNAIMGKSIGGGAKVTIVAAALFGMISGSPTANVVTTGSITIPLTKKLGYKSTFSAALAAVACTGGSIMPPVMGSAAFLMATVAGIPYVEICIAAIIPALFYYLSLLAVVHYQAKKDNLKSLPPDKIPKLLNVIKTEGYYFLPFIVVIAALLEGRSPSMTAIYGIITIMIISWFKKDTRMTFAKIMKALERGAIIAIKVTTACAGAGMVIAGIMSTGLGGKVAAIILNVAGSNLSLTLIVVAIICIILGMGMPVAAAYVITAMLAVPALIQLNVSTMAAHLFVVYFAVISAITPPVAVAAYAAAGISGSNPNTVGFTAVKLGLAGFVVPFMFVYNNSLLFEGSIFNIIFSFIIGALGLCSIAIAIVGYFSENLLLWERFIFFVFGICFIIKPGLISIFAGVFIMLFYFLFRIFFQHKSCFFSYRK